ncbi:hypothetical protein QO010_001013 [Caulobacter ginsengisoli]|uniref:DUF4386 domain-containing protein n=1 Tax=Caulobacter ginsengisoli TaxID=400775 RepID=A0ABU0IMP6_9CAUL|nr:hypothetical protein [Caulobacter ginsengisoli]
MAGLLTLAASAGFLVLGFGAVGASPCDVDLRLAALESARTQNQAAMAIGDCSSELAAYGADVYGWEALAFTPAWVLLALALTAYVARGCPRWWRLLGYALPLAAAAANIVLAQSRLNMAQEVIVAADPNRLIDLSLWIKGAALLAHAALLIVACLRQQPARTLLAICMGGAALLAVFWVFDPATWSNLAFAIWTPAVLLACKEACLPSPAPDPPYPRWDRPAAPP